jgi:Tol biopolymer transport system component
LKRMLLAAVVLASVLLAVGSGGGWSGIQKASAAPSEQLIFGSYAKDGSEDVRIYLRKAGGDIIRLTPKWDNGQPVLSPDGNRVAFISDRRGNYDVYVMEAKPEGPYNVPVRVSTSEATDFSPDFSPNGAKVVYTSSDRRILLVADSRGRGEPRMIPEVKGARNPAYSPNGKRIAFSDYPPDSRSLDIYTVSVSGGAVSRITDTPRRDERDPDYSPDGKRIAFAREFFVDSSPDCPSNHYDVMVKNLATDAEKNLTDRDKVSEYEPSFSPDGTRIAYTHHPSCYGTADVFSMASSDGSGRHNITGEDMIGFAPSWGVVGTADTKDPTISKVRPEPGTTTRDDTPYVGAVVLDNRTVLAASNLKLYVDGRERAFSYDRQSGRLSLKYKTGQELSLGKHTIKVVAQDASRNHKSKTWGFSIDR